MGRGRLKPCWVLLPLLAVGCYSYPYYGNPYGGGGPGGYPPAGGYYGTPAPYDGGYVAPPGGGTYIPMSPTTPGASPTPLNGAPTSPTSPTPTWRNSTPTDAAPYDSGINRPVPTPTNDDFSRPPAAFQPPARSDELGVSPFEPTSRLPVPTPVPVVQKPTAMDPFASSPPVQPVSQAIPQPADGNGYGFEQSGYRWLKGKLDYDAGSGTYYLIYSLTPPITDPYGGEIALMDDPQLQGLTSDDFVVVEGFVNSVQKDSRGKAKYKINSLKVLQVIK